MYDMCSEKPLSKINNENKRNNCNIYQIMKKLIWK